MMYRKCNICARLSCYHTVRKEKKKSTFTHDQVLEQYFSSKEMGHRLSLCKVDSIINLIPRDMHGKKEVTVSFN